MEGTSTGEFGGGKHTDPAYSFTNWGSARMRCHLFKLEEQRRRAVEVHWGRAGYTFCSDANSAEHAPLHAPVCDFDAEVPGRQ